MNAIFYVLRTGCRWKALPRSLGAASTVNERFVEWRKASVFERMWNETLAAYDESRGNEEWERQPMDTPKVPLGERKHAAARSGGRGQIGDEA